jgi:hypothetical protein
MNMQFPASPDNLALAQAVQRRLTAEARITTGKATMFRLLGIGGGVGAACLGIAACIYAYSYVTDARASAEKIAAAFEQALAKVTLKTEGDVRLTPDSAKVELADNTLRLDGAKVSLEPGARVALDGSNTTVSLSPNARVGVEGSVGLREGSTVKVEGNIGGQDAGLQSSLDRLRQDIAGRSGSNARGVSTNFTVFQTVKYREGVVVTGWNYKDSSETTPSGQYCYYDVPMDGGANVRLDLAQNGQMVPLRRAPRGFDQADATSNCVWYR